MGASKLAVYGQLRQPRRFGCPFGPRPIAQVADLRIPLRQPRRNRTIWRITVPGYGLGSAAMPMLAVMSTTVAA